MEIRWHGRGGQGSFTVARLLGLTAALFENKYAMAWPSFGPERRGAPVLGFTKIDTKKITDRSEIAVCDYIVVLDETLIDQNTIKGLKNEGAMLINTKDSDRYAKMFPANRIITLDATTISLEVLGRPITNTAMLGALIAVSGVVTLDSAEKGINKEMKGTMASKNIELLKKACQAVKGADHV